MIRLIFLLTVLCGPALADTLVAARTIRARGIVAPADLQVVGRDVPGALSDPDSALGLEARVVLYAGRPIRPGDLGPPAMVERNQIVTVHFQSGPIRIAMDGRTLARAGVGERIRVMNLNSRTTVTGTVAEDGTIVVTNALP